MGFIELVQKLYRPAAFHGVATQNRIQRALPLRVQLFRPVLLLGIGALIVQFALLLWAGIRPDAPGLLFVSGFPAFWFVAAIAAIRHETLRSFAMAAVFTGLVMTIVLPLVQYQYPQYGGAIVLTIVLSGLLIGEYYVGIWTVVCIILQIGPVSQDWPTKLGWCAVYIVASWLVIVFSRHLERLLEANSEAEERQRSAIVAERTRFARDIHDTLAQGFTGIMMQLNAAEQRLSGNSDQARAHIDKARQLAAECLEEARRSVGALHSAVATQGTLLDAIARIGQKLTSDSGITLEAKLEGEPYAVPDGCEVNLLRIAQEALTNAVRHAHASSIRILLTYRPNALVLEIADDGRGMSGMESPGFGIEGMRQRVREIGGVIEIKSGPGRGSRIIVSVPNG